MSPDLVAFIRWYLAVLGFGLLALPLAFRFFRRLPDRGYTVAKPLGLLTICYAFWLLGSLGFLRNDVASLLLAGALVGGLGLAWLGREGQHELRTWLRQERATVLALEAVFLAAFALWAWVRAYNPEILATEKPMEFMFINSILRSPTFPPLDAWLSGHAISYYYFGYVMVAALARLTGTAASVAFNLAIALLFALTATGALGVAMNLMALAQRERPPTSASRDPAPVAHPPSLRAVVWPGLLGPLLVVLAGNFYGVLAIAHANGIGSGLAVWAIRYDFGQPPAAGSALAATAQPGVRAGWINFWDWMDLKGARGAPPPPSTSFTWDPSYWWWFNGARVVHDRNLSGAATEAIDEMPAFSFILGDLHPHVLALPFVILAIALALEWLLWGRAASADWGGDPWQDALRHLPASGRLALSGVVLGGLSFLNTWDFPIYWFLTVAALTYGLGLSWGWEALLRRWHYVLLLAVIFVLLGLALYLPFYLTFQSQAGGVLPNLIFPTRFQQTVVMFGPVLCGVTLFTAWLARRALPALERRAALWSGGGLVVLLIVGAAVLALAASRNEGLLLFVDQALAPLTRAEAFGLLVQRRLVDSLATLYPAGVIALTVGLGVGVLRGCTGAARAAPMPAPDEARAAVVRPWRRRAANPRPQAIDLRSPAVGMSLTMLLTGALLLLGPEFVYLRDNFGTRMNTLFKFYFQTWVLWGLASAFGVWYMWRHAGRGVRWITGVVMGLAVLAGLIYTLAGVYSKTGHFAGPPTLDGMAYFARENPGDWAAIQWLQANVPGTPVILEGTRGAYWQEGRSSRISMATGLPTVLGWANHEGQWRGRYFSRVAGREQDVQTIYQVRDWAAAEALLDQYAVEYVLVGSPEEQWYRPLFLPKFDQHMRVVYQTDDVTIYRRLENAP